MPTFLRPLGSRLGARLLTLAAIVAVTLPAPASAQGSSGLGSAIFALSRSFAPGQTLITGRLYGGSITSTIDDGDNNPQNFTNDDVMRRFVIASIGEAGRELAFPGGNRAAFDDWVRDHARELLHILFPTSLSAGVSGRDTAQLHSQEFLLTQALAVDPPRRGERTSGGLLEYEWYRPDGHLPGDSGGAWRGFYKFERIHLSVDGRFARQQIDTLQTRATTIGATYHPSRLLHAAADWRVGLTTRTSLLFSQSDAMNLGAIDIGAGAWTAARKDFSRVRIGVGTLVQGSRSHVPGAFVSDDFAFVADAINDRGIAYDVVYGTVVGYAVADRVSLNAKVLETRAIASEGDRPASRLILAGVSYLVGGVTPVDVGYKVSTGGGLEARSIFLQGSFGW